MIFVAFWSFGVCLEPTVLLCASLQAWMWTYHSYFGEMAGRYAQRSRRRPGVGSSSDKPLAEGSPCSFAEDSATDLVRICVLTLGTLVAFLSLYAA